ncbi:MAG: cupredoxin domain-containing protein [Chloroflexi bacterium]|nr:cupredoxin domain-containing protein [Chloroflexota bacterium]
MTTSLLLVILASVVVAMTLLAIMLAARTRRSYARLDSEGFQELEIVIKGKYRPDSVVLRRGIPTRLHFIRQEDTPCSERVIFSDFHDESLLPAFQSTSICFIPTRCGEFLFTCAFGMYQGRLVVVEPSRRDLSKMPRAKSQLPLSLS